jgi:hypothetical protein
MKVLLPTNTTHTVKLEPRFYPTDVLSLAITKEGLNVLTTVVPTYSNSNGVISLTFDLVGVEQDRFSIKLTENNIVVYRGKLFFTSQTVEDFKLTKNTYIYV